MKQSTFSAVMANNLLTLLQGYSKTIRLLLVMLLTLCSSANMWGAEVTFDLTKASYNSSSQTEVVWTSTPVTMKIEKGSSSTNANNYLGGTNSNTRCYSGQVFSVSVSSGYELKTIVITSTSSSYIMPTSGWSNATATSNGSVVTVTANSGATVISVNPGGTKRLTKVEITYESSTPAVPCTVTFDACSGTCDTEYLTESSAGEGITLPEAEIDCGDVNWTFAGWAEASVTSETTDEPTLYKAGETYKPADDITLYAVYQRTEGDGESSEDVTFTFSEIASANSWTNGTAYTTVTISPITITANGGGNNGKYYTSNTSWRMYNGGSVNITTSVGEITAVSSNPSKDFTITDGSASLSFSATTEFKSITVTYSSSNSTTYYHSTPECTTETVVTLDPNGGAIDGDSNTQEIQTENGTLILPTPTRDGYTFTGWNTNVYGSGDTFDAGEYTDWNESITNLYAQWCATLSAPTGLNATPTKDGAIIYWEKVTGASGYEISINDGNWIPVDAGDNPSYNVTGIECGGTTVTYVVRAVGDTENGYCDYSPSSTQRSFETADCDCPNTYSFHYKNEGNWITNTVICFSPVEGATNNYLTDELYLPYSQFYKVAWQGQDQSYSVETEYSGNMPFYHNRDKKFGANPQHGNLGGGKGKFHVYHDSGDNNKYISFIPTGYTLNFGSGDEWSNDQTLYFTPKTSNWDEKEWYTDLVTLTNDQINKQIFVGLQTEVDYVWCEPYSEKLNIAGMRTKTGSGNNWVDGGMTTSYANKTGKFRIYADSGDKNWYVTFVPHYQLKYDANGGTGTMNPMPAEPVSCEDTEANRTFTIAANTFTRDNYNFTGWNTKADGTGQPYAVNNEIVLTGDVILYAQWEQQSCPAYSFHTGGSDVWNTREEDHCFVQKGSTSEWRIDNYIRPNHTHYVVNWQGGKYTNGGSLNATFASRSWDNMPFANVRSATVGQSAYGVKGSLRIYDDSNQENLYISFIPDAYVLKFGTTEYAITQHSGNDYRSEIVEYAASASANYSVSVGVADADGHYVATNHTQEMRHIFLKDNVGWRNSGAKIAIYYWGGSTGWCGFLKTVPGDATLFEGWIPTNATNIKLVRYNSNKGVPGDWNDIWNQSGDIALSTTSNLFTITSWDNQTTGWSAYSSKGKFRMHDDSGDKNWYVHFYPHYVLTYNKNHADATGSMEQQSVPKDASSKAITIAECGFARIGYDFVAWNTNMNGQGTSYNPGDTYTLNADKTLYAKWAPQQYDIIYKDQGNVAFSGENTTSLPATHTYGTATAIPDGVKTGYTFGGWYDNPECTGTPINQLGATDYTSDITLYAKWTANTNTAYTVEHYQENIDGTYPATPTDTDNLTGTTATSVTPAVKDYTGFTAPSTQTVTIAADGSTVVEYKYTRNSYTLTWNLASGEITKAGTTAGSVKFGAPLTAPTVTKAGLTFIGWDPVVPATMPAEDVTYTALWENCIWVETSIDDINEEDVVVVTMTNTLGTYALNSSGETTSAPPATSVTVTNKEITSSIQDAIMWSIGKDGDNLIFHPITDPSKNLYCNTSNNNNRVRVGNSSTGNAFVTHKFIIEGSYLKNAITSHYIGIYLSSGIPQDWRGYTSTTNIPSQTLKFYKRVCLPEGQYWVKWMVNGQEYTEGNPTTMVTDGQITAIPDNPANDAIGDCADTFIGWSESNLGSAEGQSAPTDLFTTVAEAQSKIGGITENKTFYAVFATASSGGGEQTAQVFATTDIVSSTGVTTGYKISAQASKEDGYYQDGNGDKRYVQVMKSDVSTPMIANIPISITVTANLGGGSTKNPLTNSVYAIWLDAEGNELGDAVLLTNKITAKTGSDFTANLPIANATSAYGVRVYHQKETSYNVRYYAISLSYKYNDVTYSNYVTQCCTDWTPTLTYSKTTLDSESNETATPTITGNTHSAPVSFESSNESVLKVDANNGTITAFGAGKATITATWAKTGDYCEKSITTNEITVNGNFLVTFHANDGSDNTTTQTIRSNTPTALTANTFQREGYTFQGWATSANGSKVYDDQQSVTLTTSGLDLYAVWKINAYQITIGTITGNGTITTSPASSANYEAQVTITATPAAHYTLTSVVVTRDDNSQTVIVGGNKFTMPASDVTITAVFTENEKFAINYAIPTGGGTLTDNAPTTIYIDGSITLPGIKDGTISSEYSCEEFIGWTTNPADYEAAGLKPEPFYNTGASFSDVSEDVTFYPVYSRPGAGVGGTVTLTAEEMEGWSVQQSYGTLRELVTCHGTWKTTGVKSTGNPIQLRATDNPYVEFPELQGNITQVVLNATNGSNATLTSGTFTLKTLDGQTTIASASVNNSGVCTLTVTGSYKTARLYSSVTARITNIAITYGPPAIISTTLDCSSDVDECTITYDSNESFLISGASVYGSCTNSTFRFSEIGEYTICSNIRANQYVLVGWNNQCDGKGSLTYTPGQVITSLPQNNLTLYAQWAPVVSLNDAGSVSEVNATTFGGAVALPDGEKGCDPYEFVGWTTVYPSWNEESILPTIVDNPYTPTEPTTLYAVYTQRATSPDFTANCNGGVYKIWVNNSANNHMSGQINGSNNLYTIEYWDASYSEANKTPFTITKIGENTYTIQNADGHYITRHYSDNKLAIETTWDNLDRYKWTISAGTNGSWRFTNKAATTYALIYYNNYFRLYSANNVTNGSTLYYDLELTPVESAVYYSAPSCGDYAIHFYTHGGEFVQGDYAYPTAVTEGLNGTVETKFPSATLNGYTFVGWKENAPQDELTDNSPEGDTSAEPYGLKKPGDDLITTTRREFHAVYYYYDELQDVDLSGPITTSIFAENNAGELRFLSGTPSNNPGTLSSTTACGDVAVVKITPGTGENTGKYTININGYNIIPQSGEAPGVERGTAWWYIEETSTGSGEYKIYVQNGRNIVLNGVSFGNYAYNAQGSYNGDYHYVRFGNCREHHWASDPKRKPSIILSSSGPLTITSAAGQTIKSMNKLFVGATRYETQTKIYLTCDVDGVGLLHEDGTALSSDANGEYLTTTAEGELATTYLILTYTPTATTDGIETVTITAQDEEGTAKATRLAQVRHLPENFVIAAKTGNSWVALTANITSTGTQAAPLIMVDNIALPTKATITPNTTKYQLLGLQTDKPSKDNSRFKNNGAAVHLYSTNVSKVISASTSTDNNKTYINADAAHEGAANSHNCLFYEWQLQTNDLVHYTLVNSNTTNTSNTKLGYSATYAQWGMYQTGNNVIQEVLLLPIEKDITEMDVEVMEWGTNSMALRFGSEAPATVDITLGATTTKGLSLANLNSGNTSDIYKVEGLSLAGNDCEALLITDATDASKGKLIRKPILVNGEKNGSDYTNSPTRDVCMHSDIVILNGGKLTADEAKSVGSHVDFANIYVYPGGKLVLDGNSLGVKRQVYLRGGYSWLNSTYALPEVYVNGEINFNGSGNMIYDYYIQNQKYYQFALPYDVQLAKVTDESGADDFPVWVKHYNGALRAADAYATSWEWYPSEEGDANAYFKAGIGYIIAAKPRQVGNVANRPLSIIRFPLGNSAFTGGEGDKSIETTAHGIEGYNAGTVTANNVGWNFIGNPFMATWKGNIGHKELAKHPDEDNWDGSYHWVDSDVKYITIMSPEDGSDYAQTRADVADLKPFFPFYIQETADGGSGTINFAAANRVKKAPALWNVEQDEREAYIQIEIAMDAVADQTGVFVSNKYSDEIDFDDYEKMFGSSTDKPKVWLVHDHTRLAFEAMTENRATGMTPLGYRAPLESEYMLVLNDEVSQLNNVESIYLTDYETGVTDYDLTSSAYEFESTTTLYNDTRFAIRVVMRDNTQGSVTGVDNIGTGDEQIHKFIYQDKMYILHHGVIYDATGKRVITINK